MRMREQPWRRAAARNVRPSRSISSWISRASASSRATRAGWGRTPGARPTRNSRPCDRKAKESKISKSLLFVGV